MGSIDKLVTQVLELKRKGWNDKDIATELHLSLQTVLWLASRGFKPSAEKPRDIKIGWKSMGVYSYRISKLSEIMSDIIIEEMDKQQTEVDTVVGVAINGIPFATLIAEVLDIELAVYRPHPTRKEGSFSSNFATVQDKKIVIVDDVLSTGETMSKTIEDAQKQGAKPLLAVVLVNKTDRASIRNIPLRSLVRSLLL